VPQVLLLSSHPEESIKILNRGQILPKYLNYQMGIFPKDSTHFEPLPGFQTVESRVSGVSSEGCFQNRERYGDRSASIS
jgi:hypothetical protein